MINVTDRCTQEHHRADVRSLLHNYCNLVLRLGMDLALMICSSIEACRLQHGRGPIGSGMCALSRMTATSLRYDTAAMMSKS